MTTIACETCRATADFEPVPGLEPAVGLLLAAHPRGWRRGPLQEVLATRCPKCQKKADRRDPDAEAKESRRVLDRAVQKRISRRQAKRARQAQ